MFSLFEPLRRKYYVVKCNVGVSHFFSILCLSKFMLRLENSNLDDMPHILPHIQTMVLYDMEKTATIKEKKQCLKMTLLHWDGVREIPHKFCLFWPHGTCPSSFSASKWHDMTDNVWYIWYSQCCISDIVLGQWF